MSGVRDGESAAFTEVAFAERVLAWYERHGRHGLPWHRPATPYRVWISEIMLQQTRVETVRPYFERFVARFPDVGTLAGAPLDDVLAHWSGLGYYARARNLHRTAQIVVTEHGGELPEDPAALQALPGIGRSTAGAILSLAHGRTAAILDANVKRVLARHAGIAGWPGRAAVARALWAEAEARLPRAGAGSYNQAMMDLGATVCLPRPRCSACPVATDCRARRDGATERIPGRKPRRERPTRDALLLLLQRSSDGAILLERRPAQGIWGGLWSPPQFGEAAELRSWLAARGLAGEAEELPAREHGFTHFHLRMHPQLVRVADLPVVADGDGHAWADPRTPPGGLPAPIARLLAELVQPMARSQGS